VNTAIVFIKNNIEEELATINLFEKQLIEYTISQIRRLDIESIYLVGGKEIESHEVIKRDTIDEVIEEIENESGKCVLVSPFYPLIDKEEYQRLCLFEEALCFVDSNKNVIPVYSILNTKLKYYDRLKYSGLILDDLKAKRFEGLNDLPEFLNHIREKVNSKWMNKGVVITNPATTTIGEDVTIDKNTTIGPNVTIVGKSVIGQNNVITSGSNLKDVTIGDNNFVDNSTIINSILHNGINVDPYCHIDSFTEIFDNCVIGGSVRLSECNIGSNCSIEHLSYLGNCVIKNDVKIGVGVVTVNSDGRSKHTTIIKQHTVIGSGVSLLAPITIGEYCMVGAGSTIEEDIKDGDMAIARLYQQNKKGYGYKYTKED